MEFQRAELSRMCMVLANKKYTLYNIFKRKQRLILLNFKANRKSFAHSEKTDFKRNLGFFSGFFFYALFLLQNTFKQFLKYTVYILRLLHNSLVHYSLLTKKLLVTKR